MAVTSVPPKFYMNLHAILRIMHLGWILLDVPLLDHLLLIIFIKYILHFASCLHSGDDNGDGGSLSNIQGFWIFQLCYPLSNIQGFCILQLPDPLSDIQGVLMAC